MILVDTSVWVFHLRVGDADLRRLLTDGLVLCHPFVVGELACGNIRNRREILSLLQMLPMAKTVSNEEVLQFVEKRNLMGICLALVDVHLLASALLSRVSLWTLDKQLKGACVRLGIDHLIPPS